MPFLIPNDAERTYAAQSELDSADIGALVAGVGGDGVATGCEVSAQTTPNMTVAVAAGTARINGAELAIAAGNVTVTAADATNPRIDLVQVDASGVKSVKAGVAAPTPMLPRPDANNLALAELYVPANALTIASAQVYSRVVNTARIGVRANSGTTVARRRLNFVNGSNVTVSVVDSAASEEATVTINATSGGGAASSLTDVRAYLPGGYVADGSVDYSTQLETARSAAHGQYPLWIPASLTIKGALVLQAGDRVQIDGALIGTASPALTLASSTLVTGGGTVKAGSTHAIVAASGISAWTVTGVTIDGNATQNGISGAGAANTPYDDFVVAGCRFRNSALAIRFAPSARYAAIRDNVFEATTNGIQLYRAHYLQITRNRFLGSNSGFNCISVVASSAQTFAWGEGLQITDNVIESSGRMGMEIANDVANGVHFRPVIARNAISSTVSRAISLLSEMGVCAYNQCSHCSNDAIEIGQQGALVIGNTIRDCPASSGIALNNGPHSAIIGNHIRDCKYAVTMNNGGTAIETSSRDVRIVDNVFFDITSQYFNAGTLAGAAVDYAGLLVQGNLFSWGLDAAGPTFVNLPAMASTEYRPVRILDNTFLCAVTGTPATLTLWIGVLMSGANAFAGSEIAGNEFVSRTAAPLGRAFSAGTNTSATSNSFFGVRVHDNRFANLAQMAEFTGGGGAIFWGNVNSASTQGSSPAWLAQGSRLLAGSKTQDWASLATGAQQTTTVSVPGALLGDAAEATMSVDLQGTRLSAYVSAADTVTVVQRNDTGGAVDLASGTLRVLVTGAG